MNYQETEHSTQINLPLTADTANGIWEIADFESNPENTVFNIPYTGSANHLSYVPTAKVVHMSKYGAIPSEGENALEVTLRA